jgi:hypothetical protein
MKYFALLVSLMLAATAHADLRSAKSWERLHAIIAPSASEDTWLAIPWETDLEAARQRAIREDKPIFLWQMDGHPLACT